MEQKLLDRSFILGMRSNRGVSLQLGAVERRYATLQPDLNFQTQRLGFQTLAEALTYSLPTQSSSCWVSNANVLAGVGGKWSPGGGMAMRCICRRTNKSAKPK